MHVRTSKKEKASKGAQAKQGRKNRPFCLKIGSMCFELHPLFLLFGVWYAFKGELMLFVLSCLVALQHECAHAFAAAKLGYTLNKIVLMPFGAVIDGDLQHLAYKDELQVAVSGPLCNLITAAFFAAVWWFFPVTYAYTDTAYYSSLAIATINLLPAYPLDGGRVLRCLLIRAFSKKYADLHIAAQKAERVCKGVTFALAFALSAVFVLACVRGIYNISLLVFALFLLFGALGNKQKAAYERLNFACTSPLKNGLVLRRVAVLSSCPIKDALKFITRGEYLVLEVYESGGQKVFELAQNELADWFLHCSTPYDSLEEVRALVNEQKREWS